MLTRQYGVTLLTILLLPFAASVWAEEYPKPIKHLMERGIEVEKSFIAPAGLTGYVVKYQGQRSVLYLLSDRKHVLVGNLLGEDGQDLTAEHLVENSPKQDLNVVWNKLEKATWVAEGAKEPKSVVYVIADPYCPYCNAFWQASQPYKAAGLQLRWVWVSYLREDGEAKAAAILESADPGAAIAQHESAFKAGGIAPLANPKTETLAAIRANSALMDELGVNGTPTLFYRDAKGEVRVQMGGPQPDEMAKVFGLPEQPAQ
ncbi:MAG: thiol:disulfide interchange protein DsbG [Gammaproteobacteria bacterium]